jgi:hypothetical protein
VANEKQNKDQAVSFKCEDQIHLHARTEILINTANYLLTIISRNYLIRELSKAETNLSYLHSPNVSHTLYHVPPASAFILCGYKSMGRVLYVSIPLH